jgi:hypothetical protein
MLVTAFTSESLPLVAVWNERHLPVIQHLGKAPEVPR